MKKIMFNDKFGLTQAVLEGRKKRINADEEIEVKKILTPTGKRVAQYRLIRRLNDEASVR